MKKYVSPVSIILLSWKAWLKHCRARELKIHKLSICLIFLSTSMVHKMSTSCTVCSKLHQWYTLWLHTWIGFLKIFNSIHKKGYGFWRNLLCIDTAEWTVTDALFFLQASINSNHLWKFDLTKHHSKISLDPLFLECTVLQCTVKP